MLVGACSVAVSLDGKNVYVAAEGTKSSPDLAAIVYYSRSLTTGSLSNPRFIQTDYLHGARWVTVSPDNSNVCAGAKVSNTVVCWKRNLSSGDLSSPQIFKDDLGGTHCVVFSRDGRHVYAAASSDHSVVHWNRDPETGQMGNQTVLVQDDKLLDFIHAIAVSPDDQHLYAAVTYPSKTIVFWQRDILTGTIFNQQVAGPSLNYVAIGVSPNSKNIYAASNKDDALVYFTLGYPNPAEPTSNLLVPGIIVGTVVVGVIIAIGLLWRNRAKQRAKQTTKPTSDSVRLFLQRQKSYDTMNILTVQIPSSRSLYCSDHQLEEMRVSPYAYLSANIPKGRWLPWEKGVVRSPEQLNENRYYKIIGNVYDQHTDNSWRGNRKGRIWPMNQRLNGTVQGVNSIVFRAIVNLLTGEQSDIVIKCLMPISENPHGNYTPKSGWLRLLHKPESHFQKLMRPSRHVVPILHHFVGDSALCMPWVGQIYIDLKLTRENTTMVVMPYYPYVLKDLVSNFTFDRMTKDELCALVLLQLCLGVEHLQSESVVHRDLKEDNVFVTKDGILVIGDFGTAQWVNQEPTEGSKNLNRDEVIFQNPKNQILRDIGAATVQAPELSKWTQEPPDEEFQRPRTLREVYHKTDVYAVGVMIMQLFGDERCREWIKHTDRKVRYTDNEVPRLPGFEPTLAQLVVNLLSWDRESRLDATEAATQAQQFLFANTPEIPEIVTEETLQNEIDRLRQNESRPMQIGMRLMHRQYLAESVTSL